MRTLLTVGPPPMDKLNITDEDFFYDDGCSYARKGNLYILFTAEKNIMASPEEFPGVRGVKRYIDYHSGSKGSPEISKGDFYQVIDHGGDDYFVLLDEGKTALDYLKSLCSRNFFEDLSTVDNLDFGEMEKMDSEDELELDEMSDMEVEDDIIVQEELPQAGLPQSETLGYESPDPEDPEYEYESEDPEFEFDSPGDYSPDYSDEDSVLSGINSSRVKLGDDISSDDLEPDFDDLSDMSDIEDTPRGSIKTSVRQKDSRESRGSRKMDPFYSGIGEEDSEGEYSESMFWDTDTDDEDRLEDYKFNKSAPKDEKLLRRMLKKPKEYFPKSLSSSESSSSSEGSDNEEEGHDFPFILENPREARYIGNLVTHIRADKEDAKLIHKWSLEGIFPPSVVSYRKGNEFRILLKHTKKVKSGVNQRLGLDLIHKLNKRGFLHKSPANDLNEADGKYYFLNHKLIVPIKSANKATVLAASEKSFLNNTR